MAELTIGEKIKRLREKHGLTLEQVGAAVGVGKSTVRKWETGMIANMRRDKIASLAAALHTTPAYLMGWEEDETQQYPNIQPIEVRRFPVLGEIACGQPIAMNDDRELYVTAGAGIRADYVLICHGDSMTGARIYDGDIVFIRRQPSVENGQIAAVGIDDDATLKRVYWYPDRGILILKAANPDYEDMIYSGEELDHVHILGLAVAFQSDVR